MRTHRPAGLRIRYPARRDPSFKNLFRLARALGVSLSRAVFHGLQLRRQHLSCRPVPCCGILSAYMTRSILYVDGFNFYYGVTDYWREEAKKQTDITKTATKMAGLGWCDFRALVERHFMGTDEELVSARYFTSAVSQKEEVVRHRKGEHVRYGEWARAVRTIDRLQVIQGFYQKGDEERGMYPNEGRYRETPDAPLKSRKEKQNEVNIAVEVMLDALGQGNLRPEKVYLLSGDADLMPILFALEVRLKPHIPVTVLLPSDTVDDQQWCRRYRETRARLLTCFPTLAIKEHSRLAYPCTPHILTKEILAQSLLPYTLRDKRSEFVCRSEWQLTKEFLQQYCPREDWRPVPTE